MNNKKEQAVEIISIVTALVGLIHALKDIFGKGKKNSCDKPQKDA